MAMDLKEIESLIKETLSDAPSLNQEQYQNLLSFIESKRGKKITTRLKRTHKHDK